MVQVRYNGYEGTHNLVVVQGSGPNLIGRDWLGHIRIDWARLKFVTRGSIEGLVAKYSLLFAPGTGTPCPSLRPT